MTRIPFDPRLALLMPLLLLGACATAPAPDQSEPQGDGAATQEQSQTPSASEEGANSNTASDSANKAATNEAGAASTATEVGPEGLHGRTLYQLLVADLAGRQGDIELALEGYLATARESSDPRIAERAARLALYAGKGKAALVAAQRWVQLAPDSRDAHALLARLYLNSGDEADALEHLRRVIELADGGTEAGLRDIATLLDQSQRPDTALKVATALVQDDPGIAVAHYIEARLAERVGADEQALAAAERALAIDPGLTHARLLRARVRISQGDSRAAFAALESARAKRPDDRELVLGIVRLQIDSGRRKAAVSGMQQAFERFSDDGDAVYSLGLMAMQIAAWDDARLYLERLVSMGSRVEAAHYYLGRIAQQNDDCESALRQYIQVRRGEHAFDGALRSTLCMARLGRVDEARIHLRRLAGRSQRPEAATRIILTRAQVERIAERPQQAMKILGDAIEQQPDNVDLRYNRAIMAANLDHFEVARGDLRHILELEPDNARALNALGYMLADRGLRLQEARSMIERALKKNPDDAATLDSMGWVLYRLGRNQPALEHMSAAWQRQQDAEIAAHFGEVLWATGKREKARSIWAEGRRVGPDNGVLNETVERLDP